MAKATATRYQRYVKGNAKAKAKALKASREWYANQMTTPEGREANRKRWTRAEANRTKRGGIEPSKWQAEYYKNVTKPKRLKASLKSVHSKAFNKAK